MSDIYRSQFRMPIALFEKLKSEAGKSKRSANAELVARLERSLADSSNEIDLRILFETLERLSLRNPAMRYSFGINLGGKLDERPAENCRREMGIGTGTRRRLGGIRDRTKLESSTLGKSKTLKFVYHAPTRRLASRPGIVHPWLHAAKSTALFSAQK